MKGSVGQVVVEVLEKQYALEEFSLDLVPKVMFDWELGGITDPIGQLFGWLWGLIQGAISFLQINVFGQLWIVRDWLWNSIKGAFKGISDALTTVYDYVKKFPEWLTELGKTIGAFFEPLLSAIGNIGAILTAVGKSLGDVWTYLQGIAKSILESVSSAVGQFATSILAGITGLRSFFSSIVEGVRAGILSAISGVSTFLSDLWKGISSIGAQIYTWLKSGWDWLWSGILGLKEWLVGGIKTIAVSLTQIGTSIFDLMKSIPQFFDNLWAWIQGGLKDVGATLGNAWNVAQGWFRDAYNNISLGVGEVKVALSGFINPLIDIKGGLAPFLTSYTDFIPIWAKSFTKYSMSPEVAYHQNIDMYVGTAQFKEIYREGSRTMIPTVAGGLGSLAKSIVDIGQSAFNFVVDGLKSMFTGIGASFVSLGKWAFGASPGPLESIIKWLEDSLMGTLFKNLAAFPKGMSDAVFGLRKEKKMTPDSVLTAIGSSLLGMVVPPYVVSAFFRWAGANLDTSIDFKPFGIGVSTTIRPAWILGHLAKVIYKIPDIMLSSIGYGFGMWLMQPILRLVNSGMRNDMPIEMPTLEEIRSIANRASVSDKFKDIAGDLTLFMEFYGYSDWTIDWNLGLPAQELAYLKTTVKDRFARTLTVPLTLRHQLPTGADLAAMMVRDIFPTLEDFEKVMQVQGYTADVASMYYLMRWRYPTLENLWTFIARMSAGFGWIEDVPAPEGKIGFAGTSPKAISDSVKANPIKGIETLIDKLLPYAKWWDYAPFAWQQNFTSDRLIMLDLMADIPMRIDARWMYKWSVIEEDDLMRIVVGRGMHPDFVERVTIAEAMNALTEERTAARTGVANLFESGFIKGEDFDARLTKLTTVKILGKEREIKFLEGERNLLKLRSQMDRAINVLKGFWTNLTTSFARSIKAKELVVKGIEDVATKIKAVTGLDVAIDTAYLEVWISAYEIRQETETITRVRYWMRTLIYRATQMARAGVDITKLIDDFAAKAFLTPVEIEIMKTLAGALVADAKRTSAISAAKAIVKGKLKRGAITLPEAVKTLKAAGMTEVEVQAFLEGEAKVRTVSTDKLIAMNEYIPIDPKIMEAKMEAEGVPEDEKKLYRPYAVAMEVKEEMDKVVTEMLTDWQNGLMTEAMFRDNMKKLATLDGIAKEKFGVDWMIYSPEEIEVLSALGRLRRARVLAKK